MPAKMRSFGAAHASRSLSEAFAGNLLRVYG